MDVSSRRPYYSVPRSVPRAPSSFLSIKNGDDLPMKSSPLSVNVIEVQSHFCGINSNDTRRPSSTTTDSGSRSELSRMNLHCTVTTGNSGVAVGASPAGKQP